jgi:signal transduction histidine kinase
MLLVMDARPIRSRSTLRLPSFLRLSPGRARFWFVLGVHLSAFAVLYVGIYRLLERASSQAGATAARFQLDDAVRTMPFLWMGNDSHALPRMASAHAGIGLHLYRKNGVLANPSSISPDPIELRQVRAFLAGDEPSASWVTREQGRQWVRGVVRIVARTECAPCHTPGTTLGAATMKIDFTGPMAEISRGLRTRMALLLGAWVALLGGITLLVQRTVVRAAVRLRADIAAAAAGNAPANGEQGAVVPLDPVTAEVHRNLRELVRRQHEHETQVASRLMHVDQLATLGQLAAGLAHEIKNPLAGIQGALELLRDEESDESTTRLYGEMLAELERVNGILHRLLESGRPAPLRLVRTDLARLLTDTADLLRPALRRRRVELVAESGQNLPEVEIDPGKLRQVLVNLIQNAAEAMPDTGGHVTVRATAFPAERSVVVAVEDDGPGIAQEQLARLFEPFFTTKFSGTGLGLPISKSIVEQHGGRIEVTSRPGHGTTFLILLPQHGALASPGLAPAATAQEA